MKYKLSEWDNKEHKCLKIRHDYDSECLLIILEEYEPQFYEKKR